MEATKALAFQRPSEIRSLIELAERHPHPRVRLQALGVRTRKTVSEDRGDFVRRLVDHAENPRHSSQACRLLQEAGARDVVPDRVEDPEFRALVKLSEALEGWMPESEVPDQMEVLDSRELRWPPSTSNRICAICRFSYSRADKTHRGGFALVHSGVTLFVGTAVESLSVDDLYAFFCAFESASKTPVDEVDVGELVAHGRALMVRHLKACEERTKSGPLLAVR